MMNINRLRRYKWWHLLRGHTIRNRKLTKADNCICVTFDSRGFLVPIYVDECNCGVTW